MHTVGNLYQSKFKPYRLSVAPMLDVTDRHCRYFHRLLAPHALLYTEMITTGALRYGDIERHLCYNEAEHPVALQLGGSDPQELAYGVELAQRYGYDEVNLNCGCPSARVQKGAFGACLMKEADLVAQCWQAMQAVSDIPITIKHRLGVDDWDDYAFIERFVKTLFDAGCRVFIVHARKAYLQGLSPKDNRHVPPLRYELVFALKQAFPQALFILNGGLDIHQDLQAMEQQVDGFMIGRAAWHEPYMLRQIHQRLWPDTPVLTDQQVLQQYSAYITQQLSLGVPIRTLVKPLLGLFNGQKGARQWRRKLSDPQQLQQATNGDFIYWDAEV